MGKIENVRTLQIELDPPLLNFFSLLLLWGDLICHLGPKKAKNQKHHF